LRSFCTAWTVSGTIFPSCRGPRYDPVWRPPDRSTGLATTAGDIFCMGAVAWLVLLGTTQLPVQDDHTGIWGSRNDCVNDAPQLVPGVPERIARVLRQCTSDEPAMRPSARLVQLELQPDTTSEARANSPPPTVPPSHCSGRAALATRTPSDVAVRYTTSPEASRGGRRLRRPHHRCMSLPAEFAYVSENNNILLLSSLLVWHEASTSRS